MRVPHFISSITLTEAVSNGHVHMAAGIGLLIASTWVSTLPVISGMALVTLGATAATIMRLANHRAASLLLACHASVYSSLYLLFVGAVWHASTVHSHSGWRPAEWLDLAASLCIMALAARSAIVAIWRHGRGGDATVL